MQHQLQKQVYIVVYGLSLLMYANLKAEPSKTIKKLRSKDNPDGILPAWGWKIITR